MLFNEPGLDAACAYYALDFECARRQRANKEEAEDQ
jgi:hypothetical protein